MVNTATLDPRARESAGPDCGVSVFKSTVLLLGIGCTSARVYPLWVMSVASVAGSLEQLATSA